jgi:hypothetical protein
VFDDTMVPFVQLLSVTGAWVVIVSSVSTMYRLALERYVHSEWWNDHGRLPFPPSAVGQSL